MHESLLSPCMTSIIGSNDLLHDIRIGDCKVCHEERNTVTQVVLLLLGFHRTTTMLIMGVHGCNATKDGMTVNQGLG